MSFLFTKPDSPFAPTSFIYEAIHHPITVLVTFLHYLILYLRGPSYRPPVPSNSKPSIRVVCISDTHSKIPPSALPTGDLLIHAGDLTNSGSRAQIQQSIDWLKSLLKPWPGSRDGFMHIVVVCGNHDSYLDERSRSAYDKAKKNQKLDWGKIHYLQHSSVQLPFLDGRKLSIYGAPQIPACGGKEFAFQYERGQDAWTNTVPDDVDILVTHNPPKWHLDLPTSGGLGDEFELQEIWRTRPTLQVCGHVHSGYGKEYLWWDKAQRSFEELREHVYGSGKKQFSQPPMLELFDVVLYTKALRVLYQDVKGLAWSRLWGGARQGSILVNAALTWQTSSKLGNKPQVVVL
jgi:predicted MPP superfamily phosphohydrolase